MDFEFRSGSFSNTKPKNTKEVIKYSSDDTSCHCSNLSNNIKTKEDKGKLFMNFFKEEQNKLKDVQYDFSKDSGKLRELIQTDGECLRLSYDIDKSLNYIKKRIIKLNEIMARRGTTNSLNGKLEMAEYIRDVLQKLK